MTILLTGDILLGDILLAIFLPYTKVGLDGIVCVANRTACKTKKIQGAIKEAMNVLVSAVQIYFEVVIHYEERQLQ